MRSLSSAEAELALCGIKTRAKNLTVVSKTAKAAAEEVSKEHTLLNGHAVRTCLLRLDAARAGPAEVAAIAAETAELASFAAAALFLEGIKASVSVSVQR